MSSTSVPTISVLQPSALAPVPPNPYGDINRKTTSNTNPYPMVNGNVEVNLKDRDPYKMNQHLRMSFNDIIGEPEPRLYSFDQIWVLSHKTFSVTKLWSYRILSLLFAIPCSIFWAIAFAFLSFFHIWCCAPCLKSCQIQFRYIREIFEMAMQTFIAPFMDALGRCFSHVRFTWTRTRNYDHDEIDSHEGDGKFEDVHLA